MARKLISFDWALKRLLRSKANFVVLEGFLSELLGGEIRIDELLESESNRETEDQKTNRLDLKCRDGSGRILLIELQHERQDDFLNRTVFGVSRAITEHLAAGKRYGEMPKVISINLVYFDLGQGDDYVYHGRMHFIGIHKHDELTLTEAEKANYRADSVAAVMPEYYLLKVNAFNDVAKDGLDEWMEFLKTQQVPVRPRGKGLREAKKVLDVLVLSEKERRAYEAYQDDLHQRASMVDSHYGRGVREGIKKGLQKGLQKGRKEGREEGHKQTAQAIARRLLRERIDIDKVAQITGLSVEELRTVSKSRSST